MLFNSFAFLLVFLPFSFVIYFAASSYDKIRLPVLLALSVAFYSYWNWRFTFLLAPSVVINWLISKAYLRWRSVPIISFAIALNLLVLGAFKYAGFFTGVLNQASGFDFAIVELALPLGISFFTFHHIMYLTDLRRGKAPPIGLVKYALYICFFPQVLSGPLVRWSEILHQFDVHPYRSGWSERVSRGMLLLILGLGKKVIIADDLVRFINPVFTAAAKGIPFSTAEAWGATLGFTFQIYFDFSGYTDMALGIGLIFGIVLPQNFDVPYRAASIQEFWRRWHMTLSRFLRDYLYIALGGNRHGLPLQLLALLATMTLGGLWHGAGYTFLTWGAVHGLALGVNVVWHRTGYRLPAFAGWALTIAFVVLSWVLFRAQSLEGAVTIYRQLFGFGTGAHCTGCSVPPWELMMRAALLAMVGPTAYVVVNKASPQWWIAVGAIFLMIVEFLIINDDGGNEFIYFQF
jgi:alginate O-acetyltransferase complex protein AlgI